MLYILKFCSTDICNLFTGENVRNDRENRLAWATCDMSDMERGR